MRMIRPKLDAPQTVIAEEQGEFKPVSVAFAMHQGYAGIPTEKGVLNTVIMAFRPSDEERARIAAGEDIYVSLLTFMRPQQGIIVMVGERDASAIFGVPVAE